VITAHARSRNRPRVAFEHFAKLIALLVLTTVLMARSTAQSNLPSDVSGELNALPEAVGAGRFSLRATLQRSYPIKQQDAMGLVLEATLVAPADTCIIEESIFKNGFEAVP
jgi:uncharacterized membrane-anchored protein